MANNGWRDYEPRNDALAHSWGNTPRQKAMERVYNHDYWERNRERIMAARQRARDAIGITARENRNRAADEYQRQNANYEHAMRQEEAAKRSHYMTEDLFDDHNLSREETQRSFRNVEFAVEDSGRALQRERDAARALRNAEREYANTPLGKIEDAANSARDAVNNALDSIKNLTVSAISNLRKR